MAGLGLGPQAGGDALGGLPPVGADPFGLPPEPVGMPMPAGLETLPTELPGPVAGLEGEGDDVGMDLIALVGELQQEQIAEQELLLSELLKSLGIGGAEPNPLDGAALGSMLETPDVANLGAPPIAPVPVPEAALAPAPQPAGPPSPGLSLGGLGL